jgi:hypothetical protein
VNTIDDRRPEIGRQTFINEKRRDVVGPDVSASDDGA